MSLFIYATKAPVVTANSQGFTFDGAVNVNVSVVLNNTALKQVFALQGEILATMMVDLESRSSDNATLVTGSMALLTCNMSLLSSSIGKFEFEILDATIMLLCADVIPKAVNIYLKDFPVVIHPVKGFYLLNPNIVYGTGYMGLVASVGHSGTAGTP